MELEVDDVISMSWFYIFCFLSFFWGLVSCEAEGGWNVLIVIRDWLII